MSSDPNIVVRFFKNASSALCLVPVRNNGAGDAVNNKIYVNTWKCHQGLPNIGLLNKCCFSHCLFGIAYRKIVYLFLGI